MAIDKRLKIYDNQGNEVDYDIIATDVKFAGDGKDLPTKLAELEEEIGEGGYTPPAGGIPATDLAPSVQTSLGKADSAYQKPASGIPATDLASGVIPDVSGFATADDITDAINDLVDGAPAALDTLKELADALADEDDAVAALTSALAGKVDKNGTDSLMTAAEHTKLAGLPTSTELGNTYATKTELADKVDKVTGKGLSSNDYTTAEKTKLAGLPTGSELNTTLGNKANAADVYTKAQTDAAIQEAVEDLGSGTVESVTINGTKHAPDANGDVDLGTIQGEKGEKGDTGNVEFEDLADLVALLVNDLTTGGAGNFLSAEMGLVLRREITRVHDDLVTLYGKLANMAFWDAADRAAAEPRSLNFNVPQVQLNFDLTGVGSGVSVKLNGESFNSPVSVDKGGTNTLTIQAIEDWALNNDIAVEIDGVAQTLTESGGIYSLEFAVNANTATVEVVGTATQEWFIAPRNDVSSGGTVTRYGWQAGRNLSSTGGYLVPGLNGGMVNMLVAPAGWDESVKRYTRDKVYGNYGNSNPGKTAANYLPTGGKRYLKVKIVDTAYDATRIYAMTASCFGSAVVGNAQANYFNTAAIDGFKARLAWQPNLSDAQPTQGLTKFTFDLTESGATAQDIAYVKLCLQLREADSTRIDTSTYVNNWTVKYKFTDSND